MASGIHVLEREQLVGCDLVHSFGFFAEAANLEAITPPWLSFRIDTPGSIEMREGALIEYRLRLHGVPLRWRTRIARWDPPRAFVDEQVRGPYRSWRHTHSLEAVEGGTLIRDRVEYSLPFGPLGELAHRLLVRRDLRRIFDFRRDAVARLAAG